MPRCAVIAPAVCACLGSACGRIAFDVATGGSGAPDAAASDAMPDGTTDAGPSRIAYVGPFVQRSPGTGATDTFTAQARAAGNAVVIQASCAANAIPTAVSLVAPGWSFTQLGPITPSSASVERSATFVAIAPDTVGVTVSITWSGSNCNSSKNHVGDEFTLTDPRGGTMTFDAVAATEGVGDCVGTITTAHAGDAVWAACNSNQGLTAVGAGFTKGADDRAGDWSEYKLTTDPAGTVQSVRFANANVGYVLSMVTLAPR